MENLDSVLDNMTDKLIAYDEIAFLDMVQYVWRRGWSLDTASTPSDDSELRRALKACIIERMVELWTAPPRNTAETAPVWCSNVPALSDPFSVIKPEEQSFWEDEPSNPIFEKRNIFAPKEFMFFL
ncbi:hypothetical protein [Agaribacterium sp. ZY112]|uniref:hypothetical protein n=1 Tax=Agaribacterium sp. ZY112 TaxID=3233574 RepID=UPI00352592BF